MPNSLSVFCLGVPISLGYLARGCQIPHDTGNYLPSRVRKLLYQTFVLPHLDYCLAVWHSCGVTLSQKIERVQNYAVIMRSILRKPHRTSSEPLRRLFQLQTLSHRRANNACLRFADAYQTRPLPICQGSLSGTIHCHGTMQLGAAKLHLRRPKTEFYRRSNTWVRSCTMSSLRTDYNDPLVALLLLALCNSFFIILCASLSIT